MADFFTELWTSVFTPGTTPTLVVATNVSFAALQLLLLALLAATYSVHFAILSVLCGGLWWSINWFVHEVNALKEEDHVKKKKEDKGKGAGNSGRLDGDAAADSEDTETEEPVKRAQGLRQRPNAAGGGGGVAGGSSSGSTFAPASSTSADIGTVVASSREEGGDLSASTSGLSIASLDSRKQASTGNVSGTDSEWDKLDSEVE